MYIPVIPLGAFVEHNRKIFGAVQHSIMGTFLSIIGSALNTLHVHNGRYSPKERLILLFFVGRCSFMKAKFLQFQPELQQKRSSVVADVSTTML